MAPTSGGGVKGGGSYFDHFLRDPPCPSLLPQVPWSILPALDDDWPLVVCNLRRVKQKWTQLTRVLRIEGVDAQTSGRIYLEVVQEVFLYGSETWVMKPRIGGDLVRFHHRVARRMTGLTVLAL